MTQLISLKMRNNPLRELPSGKLLLYYNYYYNDAIITLDISKLHKLEIMSLPFNLLSDLPQG